MSSDELDRETILARVGGDVDLLCSLYELLQEDCQEGLENLQGAFCSQDVEGIFKASHFLKSAIGNFSEGRAYTTAGRIEHEAKGALDSGDAEDMSAWTFQLSDLEGQISSLLTQVETFLAREKA